MLPPKREAMPPALNFAPLDNAATALDASARRYSKAMKAFTGKEPAGNENLLDLNNRLIQTERRLIDPTGLPRRPWYKNLIYAPGVYAGYAAKTLPAVREGIEQKHYEEAEAEISRVAKALQAYAAAIDEAAGELEKAVK
jgi:N-acetylated-alpha-linked acidic dipeptidase